MVPPGWSAKAECKKWNAKGTSKKAGAEREPAHVNTLVCLRPRADLAACAHSSGPWFRGKGKTKQNIATNTKKYEVDNKNMIRM